MRILAIETSCDDTGIAILEINPGGQPRLLANLVSSQTKIHAPWGGVVPMLARREHQKNLVPILGQVLKEAGLLAPFGHSEHIRFAQYKLREESLANASTVARIRERSFGLRPQDDDTLQTILDREPDLFKKLLPFLKKYQKPNIDSIAVTIGPGLEPALWVGVNLARALAFFWNLPIIPVNHVEAHISTNWFFSPVIASSAECGAKQSRPIAAVHSPRWSFGEAGGIATSSRQGRTPRHDIGMKFPAICLVVSGGHTQIILMRRFGRYKILGETRDDAAGEAFDKVAKMLNLGYPGGPAIAKQASQWNFSPCGGSPEGRQFPPLDFAQGKISPASPKLCRGRANFQKNYKLQIPKIKFPRPMINSKDYDFSFSGLKTAVLYFVKTLSPARLKKLTPAIAAEFQQAVIDVLVAKTIQAAREFKAKTVLLSGGVAANDALRETLKLQTTNYHPSGDHPQGDKLHFLVPPKNFCTDNAAMVALTAYEKTKNKSLSRWLNWRNIKADANLKLN